MCGKQKERIAIATTISQAVDAKIKSGAVNLEQQYGDRQKARTMDRALDEIRQDAKLAVTRAGEALGGKRGMQLQLTYLRAVKNSTKALGVANCGEYAGFVFWKLYKRGIFPISFVQVARVKHFHNHAFVVIGLTDAKDSEDMNDWKGRDLVICDPWLMRLLDMKNKQAVAVERGAYTPEEYIQATAKYFYDGTNVGIAFGLNGAVGEVPKIKLR